MSVTLETLRAKACDTARTGSIIDLDKIELDAIKVLGIKPYDGKGKRYEDALPISISHEARGLVVCWYPEVECDECEGSGYLDAYGATGECYSVECPKCEGCATLVDEDSEFSEIITDIDGLILEIESE